MKRRNFIKASVVGTGFLTANLPQPTKSNLEIIVLNTNWGYGGTTDEFCRKSKEAGYNGIELWWPSTADAQKEVFNAIQKHEMQIGFLCGGGGSDVKVHLEQFKNAVKAATGNTIQKPLFINCHSGKDFFSIADNHKFIEFTLDQEQKSGIEIFHETHRGRMCFSAPITKSFLMKYPKMKLTLDLSHWTNVHESMLDDQKESLDLACARGGHIHARVGHEEGPQVNDPRAPEWKNTLEKHLAWWDKAVANREKEGYKRMTFLTEFGPPNYMPVLPYTRQPVANQWDINVYMKNLIKERYTK
jgi:sugar phosphate isomerase/epimerase